MSAAPRTDFTNLDESPSAPTEVSELLTLGSRPARILLYLFIASNVVYTLATLNRMSSPWPSFVALALISMGALLVTRQHLDPFPLLDSLLVIGAVAVSALVVSWSLPEVGSLGRESWHLGGGTWLLFFLALRRRAGLAWLGMLLLVTVTTWWSVSVGRSPLSAITLMQTHMALLVVATLFASTLRRTARIINTLTARSVDAAAEAAAADAGQEIRRQRVAELAALAVPPLERIASGKPLTNGDRREFQTVEAELRDSVRGRSLAIPAVTEAARDARSRGVTVNLLDDRGGPLPAGDAMLRLGAIVVDALSRVEQGTVTVRMLPPGRDAAVTVVSSGAVQEQRMGLDEAAEPINR